MSGLLKNTVAKRLHGQKPSVLKAALVAAAAGAAAAVLTYRVMRS